MLGLSVFPRVAQHYIKKPLAKNNPGAPPHLSGGLALTRRRPVPSTERSPRETDLPPALKMILARLASPAGASQFDL